MYFRGQITLILLSSVLLGVSGSVLAEGGCPPGYYPHNVPGLRGCAPIPGYESSPSRWNDAYGTLVWWNSDDGTPQYSYSAKYTSESLAEKSALEKCQVSGGNNCNAVLNVRNGYIAIDRNEFGGLSAASGNKPREAREELRSQCRRKGGECDVIEVIDTQGSYTK